MPFSTFRFIPFLLLFTLAACDSNDLDSFEIERYTGDPYEGTLTMEATIPTEGTITLEYPASLQVTNRGNGQARIVLDSEVNDGEPLVFDATYTDSGAQVTFGSGSSAAVFGISPSGSISGTGEVTFFDTVLDVSASGNATSTRINSVLNIDVVSGNEETPTGTEVTVRLDLTR